MQKAIFDSAWQHVLFLSHSIPYNVLGLAKECSKFRQLLFSFQIHELKSRFVRVKNKDR